MTCEGCRFSWGYICVGMLIWQPAHNLAQSQNPEAEVQKSAKKDRVKTDAKLKHKRNVGTPLIQRQRVRLLQPRQSLGT
jgi:hypothetical protein